jgi:hypothetical protein
MMKRSTSLALLVIIILIGFALRLYRLDAVAFRGDEAFSAQYWAGEPLAVTFASIATLEPHPPLTYILFRAWGLLVGIQHEFSLRLLGVLPNTIGIAAMYAFGTQFSRDRRVGLLSAALWALHPLQIWHAQDFRNYAMWAGLSVVTLWSALRIMQHQRLTDWILYVIVATVTGYIFYMELLTIGVLGLYVLVLFLMPVRTQYIASLHKPDVRFVIQWCVVNGIIIGLVFAAFFSTQGNLVGDGGYGGTTGGFNLSEYGYWFLTELNFGETLSLEFRLMIWFPLLIAFVFAWLIIASNNWQQALFLALLTIVPLVMIGIISTKLNIFRPRYIMMSSPAYILLLTTALFIGYERAKSSTKYRVLLWVIIGLVLSWVLIATFSLRNYYFNPLYRKAHDWVTFTDYLREHTQPGEVVIQTAVDSAYGFYYDAPAADFALPRSPDQPQEEIIDNLEEWRDRYSSLWVVARTLQWQNAGIVEAWVEANMQLVRDTSIDGLPIREYKTWEVAASEIADTPLTTFGDSIDLIGAQILPEEPTGEVPIWLYWQPQTTTNEPLTVFVQLIGAVNPATGSPLWTQDDHPPQHGRVSTDLWETGIVYRDVYELPLGDIPAGTYEVQIGFYNPVTGERLLATSGDNYFVSGTLEVE